MNGIEREAAEMFAAYICAIAAKRIGGTSERASAAVDLARGMADIFERNPRAGPWAAFDKVEFLRLVRAN